jgi:DNA-binding MltR family transcriptional regulator
MVSKRQKARLEAITKKNDLKGFLEEFRRESDRATAILGAAYLDEEILQLLTEFLVDDEMEVRELLDNEKPLGAFGARIRAAYCMGLISKEDFQDLKLIKTIRNEFAHQLHGLSFDDESIASKCMKLQAHKRAKKNRPSSTRDMFIHSTMFILMELNFRMIIIENKRCKTPPAPELF